MQNHPYFYYPNPNLYYAYAPIMLYQIQLSNSQLQIQNQKGVVHQEIVDDRLIQVKQKEEEQKLIQVKKKKIRIKQYSSESSQKSDSSQYINYKKSKKLKLIQKRKKNIKTRPNQERNIVPNLIQQVFSFLSKSSRSKSYLINAFKHLDMHQSLQINVKRFYIYQKKIKQRLDHCVNLQNLEILSDLSLKKMEQVKQCFSENEILIYQKISRILASYFLKFISPLLTLHSKRMPEQKRYFHLSKRRQVLSYLKQLKMI